MNWAMLLPRLALTGCMVHWTGILTSSRPGSGYRIITLWPRMNSGSRLPTRARC